MLPIQKSQYIQQCKAYIRIMQEVSYLRGMQHQSGIDEMYYKNNCKRGPDWRNSKTEDQFKQKKYERAKRTKIEDPQIPRASTTPVTQTMKQEYISVIHQRTQVVEKSYTGMHTSMNRQSYNNSQSKHDVIIEKEVQTGIAQQPVKAFEVVEENSLVDVKQEPVEEIPPTDSILLNDFVSCAEAGLEEVINLDPTTIENFGDSDSINSDDCNTIVIDE